MRDAQRLHQKQAHGRFDEDNDQRGDMGGLQIADDVLTATDHGRHRPGNQPEIHKGAAEGNDQHQGGDKELHGGGGRESMLRPLGVCIDVFVLLHLCIDASGTFLQAGQVSINLGQGLIERAPERHESLKNLVALFVRLAILGNRLVVDPLHGLGDVAQNLLHQAVAGGRDLRNGRYRLGPFGRCRWHLAAFLIVLFDARDLAHEFTLKHRVIAQIPLHYRRYTLEFALDALRNFFLAMRE